MRLKSILPRFTPVYALLLMLLVGAVLRFWQLDGKPLWMDEVLTALFVLGRRSQDIPQNQLFGLTELQALFTLQPQTTCRSITVAISTESVHPPLFFCLLHQWLAALGTGDRLVWSMRAFSAVLGVAATAALYGLGVVSHSATVGLLAAALMAVSPFAVYLSQEARHYTLPMLLITLALIGLVQIQQDLQRNRWRPWVWLGWVAANGLALYTHYFCGLALVAQAIALLGWMVWQRRCLIWHSWGAVGLALGAIGLSYVPWLMTLVGHSNRSETNWMQPFQPEWTDRIAPLYQTLVGWVLMVIALPVEEPFAAIALVSGGVMLLFTAWLGWVLLHSLRGIRQLGDRSIQSFFLLVGFIVVVVAQFLGIAYLLGRDITVVPRYNFVYYPAMVLVLAIALSCLPDVATGRRVWGVRLQLPAKHIQRIVLVVGLVSSVLTVNGLVFLKPFYPNQTAREIYQQGDRPIVLITATRTLQETAQGLSIALALQHRYPSLQERNFLQIGFVPTDGSDRLWQDVGQLRHSLPLPLNVWVIAPGYRKRDFPDRLAFFHPLTPQFPAICLREPDEYHRTGFPYQLYECGGEGVEEAGRR